MQNEEFDAFKERLNRFQKGFNELVKDQSKKNVRFDEYGKKYSTYLNNDKIHIKLNVGGFLHTTTKTTLLRKNSKYFERRATSLGRI